PVPDAVHAGLGCFVDDFARAAHVRGRGPVGLPDHLHLVRVHAGGGGVTGGHVVLCFGVQADHVLDVHVHGSDGRLAVGAGGEQHPRACVPGHGPVGGGHSPGAHREAAGGPAQGDHQVLGAPHQPHHGFFGGDLGRGEHSAG